jgi:hypothetical protein
LTPAELQARAIDRAHREHVHIFRIPGRPGVFRARSKNRPNERYSLVMQDGVEACSCRSFNYRRVCEHVEALRNRLAWDSFRHESVAGNGHPETEAA